jgi:outer membrane protein OmpA-like peptidoglycan-associated protein
MSTSQNQRWGRTAGSGVAAGRGSGSSPGQGSSGPGPSGSGPPGSDALAGLRQAVADQDPGAFARCFSDTGWVRVPRPEGDVVLRGRGEIERLGHELGQNLRHLTWTPSQRFVAAGQVVEEAVARAWASGNPTAGDQSARDRPAGDRPAEGARTRGEQTGGERPEGEIRVPMRVVAALDPSGGIGSLTVWVDWAALHDPLGVDSARGAASALVAQARARDARGLQVIVSEPGAAPVPPIAAVPLPRVPGSGRPPAAVLWWKQHWPTLAGSAMALAAAAVIGWVAVNALRPLMDDVPSATGPGLNQTASASADGANRTTGGTTTAPDVGPEPAASRLPVVNPEKPDQKPFVQRGKAIPLPVDFLFETGSTDLTQAYQARLKEIANDIRVRNITGTIQVNGYTDDVGSRESNLKLSSARAAAVALVLSKELRGVAVELNPQGFGEPENADTSDEGRAKNRRVYIVLPAADRPKATPSAGR